MNRFLKSLLLLLLIPQFATARNTPVPTPDILPSPRDLQMQTGAFVLGPRVRAFASVSDDSTATAYRNFRELAALELGLELPDLAVSDNLAPCQILLAANPELVNDLPPISTRLAELGPEAYELSITPWAIRVTANTSRGLFWGLVTLVHLVRRENDERITFPALHLLDWPDYPWRGYMLDTGRAPYTPAQIQRTIRIAAMFKLNFLMLREGDDELNAFRYDMLPIGRRNPYSLSISDLRDLITYGERFGVRVFFEIESLGHAAAKRLFYPDVIEGGIPQEYWPGFVHVRKANFRVGDLRTYQILQSMYEELFPLLRFPVVHLGLDEVRLPREKQAEHLRRLIPLVDRIGQKFSKHLTMIVWSDAPPTPAKYRDRVVRCLWVYNDSVTAQMPRALNQGLAELLQPDCTEKALMAGGSGTHHRPFSKDPYPAALRNLYSWAVLGKGHPNFLGLLAVQWATNVVDQWFPNFLMAADFGWAVPRVMPEPEQAIERILAHLQKLRDYREPLPEEVPQPAWDGIWLDGAHWGEDILTGQLAAPTLAFAVTNPYFDEVSEPVQLLSNHPEGRITYTLDGSEPTRSSPEYWGPFRLHKTTRVRARCFVPGRTPSYIVEKTFISLKPMPALKPKGRLQPRLLYAFYKARLRYAESLKRLKPTRIGVCDSVEFPSESQGVEQFGLVFVGYVQVPDSGEVTFFLRSNDGSRLYLDGVHLINNDGLHGSREDSATVNLNKGLHSLRIEYFQAGGGRDLALFWKRQGFEKTQVPASALFHTGYGADLLK